MRKLIAFTIVSVDGYFAGPNGEIDWFKSVQDKEDREFTFEASGSSSMLIFGHTTYEMMKSYWPTPDAIKNDPVMAEVMNSSPKIVFSKTMKPVKDGPVWKNVRVLHEIKPEEIMKLKEQGDNRDPGKWHYRATVCQSWTHRRIPADGHPGDSWCRQIPVQGSKKDDPQAPRHADIQEWESLS
ncbi:MAG: dihydrofolate reductase family protein [Methanomicrobiales archaeon]|nr:dihydrofolate reductase family protein [Methanomicrobiales archaeon]